MRRANPKRGTKQLSLRVPLDVLAGIDSVAGLLSSTESLVVVNGASIILPPRRVSKHHAAVFALQYGIKKLLEDAYLPESEDDADLDSGTKTCSVCHEPVYEDPSNPVVSVFSNLNDTPIMSYRHTKCVEKESFE